MSAENHRALHDAPDHLIARRKLFISAAAVLVHQLLANKASAMLPSLEGSPVQPTIAPVALRYHDINFPRPGNIDEEGNWVPQRRFIAQIEATQTAGYKIGTLSEALRRPDEVIALTFDDGIRTAYSLVFPYLRSKNIKATFFVPVDALLKKDKYHMTTNQVSEMSNAEMEVSSHSFDHVPLTLWDIQMVRLELRRSKEFLEDLTGKEVKLFAYPDGKHDRRVAEEVLRAGYRAAFISRRNTRLGLEPPLDRFELPRFWITQKTDISTIFPSKSSGKPSKTE